MFWLKQTWLCAEGSFSSLSWSDTRPNCFSLVQWVSFHYRLWPLPLKPRPDHLLPSHHKYRQSGRVSFTIHFNIALPWRRLLGAVCVYGNTFLKMCLFMCVGRWKSLDCLCKASVLKRSQRDSSEKSKPFVSAQTQGVTCSATACDLTFWANMPHMMWLVCSVGSSSWCG